MTAHPATDSIHDSLQRPRGRRLAAPTASSKSVQVVPVRAGWKENWLRSVIPASMSPTCWRFRATVHLSSRSGPTLRSTASLTKGPWSSSRPGRTSCRPLGSARTNGRPGGSRQLSQTLRRDYRRFSNGAISVWETRWPAAWEREDERKSRRLPPVEPNVEARLSQVFQWRQTGDFYMPWDADVDGHRWQVRPNRDRV